MDTDMWRDYMNQPCTLLEWTVVCHEGPFTSLDSERTTKLVSFIRIPDDLRVHVQPDTPPPSCYQLLLAGAANSGSAKKFSHEDPWLGQIYCHSECTRILFACKVRIADDAK